MATRKQNEKKFSHWQQLGEGGRRYWYEVEKENGVTLRYIKIVDANEVTVAIIQELYDLQGKLFEIHEKFPVDRGHRRV